MEIPISKINKYHFRKQKDFSVGSRCLLFIVKTNSIVATVVFAEYLEVSSSGRAISTQ